MDLGAHQAVNRATQGPHTMYSVLPWEQYHFEKERLYVRSTTLRRRTLRRRSRTRPKTPSWGGNIQYQVPSTPFYVRTRTLSPQDPQLRGNTQYLVHRTHVRTYLYARVYFNIIMYYILLTRRTGENLDPTLQYTWDNPGLNLRFLPTWQLASP